MGVSSNPLAAGVPSLRPPSATQTMISPDGQYGEIPVERVQDAISAGFKPGMNMISPDGSAGTVPVDKAHDAMAAGFKPSGLTLPESKLYAQHPANVLYKNIRQNESPDQIAARQQTAQNVSKRIEQVGQGLGVIGGMIAAPIPTAVGLATGIAGQAAGTKVAKHYGADDTTAQNIGNVTGLVTGIAGGGLADAAAPAITNFAKGAVDTAISPFRMPAEPVPSLPTPKPVAAHVDVATPFDDALLRKSLGGKDLSPGANGVIKDAAGSVIPPGSSPENHLMRAIGPINNTISTQGAALDQVIQNAGPLSSNPSSEITAGIKNLKDNLPGGTEEQFGKTIDKEVVRYQDAMGYTDPASINVVIRNLDSRINSFTAPEDPINTPADAQDAARVTLRRILRNKLDTDIPDTAPINAELSTNIEARNLLQKKFGKLAFDPAAADAQQQSELGKGQTIVQNQANDAAQQNAYDQASAKVKRNIKIAELGGAVAGAPAIWQGLKSIKILSGLGQ